VRPECGPGGTQFEFSGTGFQPGENVGIYVTAPDQSVIPADFQVEADSNGNVGGVFLSTTRAFPLGIYAVTYEGTSSHRTGIAYFKVIGTAPTPTVPPGTTPVPVACDTSGNKNGEAVPSSARPGDVINFTARGFKPGERVSYWFTLPNGDVGGTTEPTEGLVRPNGVVGPLPLRIDQSFVDLGTGTWALTFQGETSGNQAIIFFCINP
jgi:hypothetical protein